MKRYINIFIILAMASILIYSVAGICSGQVKAAIPGKSEPGHVQRTAAVPCGAELKGIGHMIARGEPVEKYRGAWKDIVGKSKNMDINSSIQCILNEAKTEAGRNVAMARAKVQKYDLIKRDLTQEINRSSSAFSGGQQSKLTSPIQGKIYSIENRNPDKFSIQRGGMISNRADLEKYILDLKRKLNSLDGDAQLANVDLQNALQQQQQTLQMMSNISKMLHDTGMSIIRKVGG